MAPCPSGKGAVCKTVLHQFDSDWRLLKRTVQAVLFFYGESRGYGPHCSACELYYAVIKNSFPFILYMRVLHAGAVLTGRPRSFTRNSTGKNHTGTTQTKLFCKIQNYFHNLMSAVQYKVYYTFSLNYRSHLQIIMPPFF